ncbi:MAG TPA: ATP-binding cassette domain-containing protein, partial [Synergistaceae bacterium]|nr:ATP-binding cassette domain-containing protein [Synergistaceae bacterium]
MLKVSNLWAGYDEVSVLHDVTLEVHPGEVVALVGANGAGKSTMMRCLAGLLKPTGGSIQFLGEEIGGLPAAQVVARGLAYVPQDYCLFPHM